MLSLLFSDSNFHSKHYSIHGQTPSLRQTVKGLAAAGVKIPSKVGSRIPACYSTIIQGVE
jgi:hypothetical protein